LWYDCFLSVRNRKKRKNTEKTLDEILAPVRKEVAEKGISEEEIDDLVKQARRDYFRDKNAK
jgi:hypothetical protein